MPSTYGRFDDANRAYVITDPDTPQPWVNYLSNGRFVALLSNQAGGLCFLHDPQTRRLTRYHWLSAPADRPGFYVYLKGDGDSQAWNPHFAPTRTPLTRSECRHAAGSTTFTAERDGLRATLRFAIPASDDVLLWDLTLENLADRPRTVQAATYCEFGILEFAREVWWCYLKSHTGTTWDEALGAIRYDYHAFEAVHTPRVLLTATRRPDGFDCARDGFLGRGRGYEAPQALERGPTGSQLPGGGQGCGSLYHRLELPARGSVRIAWALNVAATWEAVETQAKHYATLTGVDAGLASLDAAWAARCGVCQIASADPHLDRVVNTWGPLNAQIALERTRDISTDHMGLDGARFRDTAQDALAVANSDPEYAKLRLRQVLAVQHSDGGGVFNFFPYGKQEPGLAPHRSDNTVWPVYTIDNLVRETGSTAFLDEVLPWRDGGTATIYEHLRRGLQHIWERRGPHGLPTLFHADWNDGLAVFRDEAAESVMLGLQLVHAANLLRPWAEERGDRAAAALCVEMAGEMTRICNSDVCWDGGWYRRLLLSNGLRIGSSERPQGRIYLEPQVWAVMSGVATGARAKACMDAAWELLGSKRGLLICAPPYTGFPNPTDPLVGNAPGTGENGAIFCHANTWAVIAYAMLGDAERAYTVFRQVWPGLCAEEQGQDHWGKEPYVFNSTINGPARGADFGKAGISWLTGTATWMQVALTQHLLGVRPERDRLAVSPCLPESLGEVRVVRRLRGQEHRLRLRGSTVVEHTVA